MKTQQKKIKQKDSFFPKLKLLSTLFLTMFLLSGCGLVSSVKDLTNSATQLLDDISDVTRLLDSKVENGELQQEVADLVDGRLEVLAEILESTIQNNGGFLFDQANGTIDNVFMNISLLLDQIKQGVLDESLPALVSQLSSELQQNINLISSNLEDLVVLTFGNTFVLLDKATNSLILIISMVLLGIGIIIFVLLLFRKNRKLTGSRIAGFIFMIIFVLFFLGIIVYTPFRGYIIAGLDFGEKYEGVELKPKITGVFPETFVIGKSDKIYLYGKHLNLLDTFKVKLSQGNTVKFTFPDKNIIVNAQNKIVLGNFDSNLKWVVPSYTKFKTDVSSIASIVGTNKYIQYANGVAKNLYPIFKTMNIINVRGVITPSAVTPESDTRKAATTTEEANVIRGAIISPNFKFDKKLRFSDIQVNNLDLAKTTFGTVQGNLVTTTILDYFKNLFKLPEGDFGIAVYESSGDKIESSQLFSVVNPPPPAPDPDIFITSLNWSGGLVPVAKQQTSLDIGVGFKYPEEVKRQFKLRVTTSPATTPIDVTVKTGDIAAAKASNTTVVKSRNFSISSDGQYAFSVRVDQQNVIKESNESNNLYSKNLKVKKYIYDVKVQYLSFQSKDDMDNFDSDEYRIKVRTSVTGKSIWSFDYNKSGEPGNTYNINRSKTFSGLLPGHAIIMYTSGKEADSGFYGGDDYMGEFQKTVYLSSNPTSGNNSKEVSFTLNASKYKIIGKYLITRKAVF